MNKEELKKEAEEKAKKRTKGFKCQDNCEKSYVMGALDFAEPREKQLEEKYKKIIDLEKHNEELLALINAERGRQEKCNDIHLRTIADLEKELAISEHDREHNDYELVEVYKKVSDLKKENAGLKEQLTKTKDLIENIIRVTWSEGWNYSLDWKVKAEQYLKDLEK